MKLEDIPKKNIFDVPEGYFEKLPGMIQARTASARASVATSWAGVFKYALPVVAVVLVSIWWWGRADGSVEEQLGNIETTDLVAYLEGAEMEAEELVEGVTWTEVDSNELEEAVYEDILNTSAAWDDLLEGYELQ